MDGLGAILFIVIIYFLFFRDDNESYNHYSNTSDDDTEPETWEEIVKIWENPTSKSEKPYRIYSEKDDVEFYHHNNDLYSDPDGNLVSLYDWNDEYLKDDKGNLYRKLDD